MIFERELILEIHQQAVASGLHNKRDLMLAGINVDYVARLDRAGNPSDQLLTDLFKMNADGVIIGGVPLERWLRNAAYASGTRPDRQRFFRDLADNAAKYTMQSGCAAREDGVLKERIFCCHSDSPLAPHRSENPLRG